MPEESEIDVLKRCIVMMNECIKKLCDKIAEQDEKIALLLEVSAELVRNN